MCSIGVLTAIGNVPNFHSRVKCRREKDVGCDRVPPHKRYLLGVPSEGYGFGLRHISCVAKRRLLVRKGCVEGMRNVSYLRATYVQG